MIAQMKKMPPKQKKFIQDPRIGNIVQQVPRRMEKQRHAPRKGNKPHPHSIISHTSCTCHYVVKLSTFNGDAMEFPCQKEVARWILKALRSKKGIDSFLIP